MSIAEGGGLKYMIDLFSNILNIKKILHEKRQVTEDYLNLMQDCLTDRFTRILRCKFLVPINLMLNCENMDGTGLLLLIP